MYFKQAKKTYESMDKVEKMQFISGLVQDIMFIDEDIQRKILIDFEKIDKTLSEQLKQELKI